eukprot:149297_1
MEWCCSVLYTKRNQLPITKGSINHGVHGAFKNRIDIELFCNELVKKIQSAQGQLQHNVDCNMLCIFCERFACIKHNDIRCDILYKHWMIDNEIRKEQEFKIGTIMALCRRILVFCHIHRK